MINSLARVRENEIAFAITRIAATQSTGIATLARCKKEIPDLVKLSNADWKESETRPGEPLWHQLIRNIKSHCDSPGNYVNEGYLEHLPRVGYRVTDAGRRKKKP